MDLIRYSDSLGLEAAETLYERVVGYGFARRYVDGKIVADIGREGLGYGSNLLAGSAKSVTGMSDSADHVELASASYPAPNVAYENVDLSELPYPEDYFDVVVALGIVEEAEQTQSLLKEARRVLKQDGVLIISARDRQTGTDARREGVYVLRLRESLEGYFESVLMYGQGAVAGGFVSPVSTEVSDASTQSASLALTAPHVGLEPPVLRSVLAVCGPEALEGGRPYLLLDRDRRIFDECEDRTEDVELLRDEIQRMQETEVLAFQDSLKLHRTEIAYLRAQVRSSRAELNAEMRNLKAELNAEIRRLRDQVHAMENSTTWRIFEPYRRLRSRVDTFRRRTPGGTS